MNKEEAKVRIDSIINHLEWRHGGGTDCVESDRDQAHQIIDQIELVHPKVKLPREVGEYLEDWLKANSIDTIITDLVYYEGNHMAVREWWDLTPDATYLIADMARYGWEAEPEAKWYVKAPESWKADAGGQAWLFKPDYGGIESCNHTREEDEQFTRAELKQYHLDSGIFKLVPVEEEK